MNNNQRETLSSIPTAQLFEAYYKDKDNRPENVLTLQTLAGTAEIVDHYRQVSWSIEGEKDLHLSTNKGLTLREIENGDDYVAARALITEFSEFAIVPTKEQLINEYGFTDIDLEGIDSKILMGTYFKILPHLLSSYSKEALGHVFRRKRSGPDWKNKSYLDILKEASETNGNFNQVYQSAHLLCGPGDAT